MRRSNTFPREKPGVEKTFVQSTLKGRVCQEKKLTIGRQTHIPPPAHPDKRREPLPWQRPRSEQEDPNALRLTQAIREFPVIAWPNRILTSLPVTRFEVRDCSSNTSNPN